MIKILLVSNMYPSAKFPYYGTFVKNFENCLNNNTIGIVNRVVITKTNYNFLKLLKYLLFVFQNIYKVFFTKYDIIYIHYINHSLIPYVVLKYFIKTPIILNAHGGDIFHESKSSRFLSMITSSVIPYATKIVVPSNYFKLEVVKRFDYSPENIFISPSSGVDLLVLYSKSKKINLESINIGYLGRIDQDKGWDTFILAMKELKKEKININIHIGGDGKQSKLLDDMILKSDLKNVTIRYGFIDHKKINSFFNKIDILIFPSRRKGESLGLVAIEALACGVPVIANNNGAISDFIKNGINGFIYDDDNKLELVKKVLIFVALNHEDRIAMSKNANDSVKKYDANIISSEMIRFINETLNI